MKNKIIIIIKIVIKNTLIIYKLKNEKNILKIKYLKIYFLYYYIISKIFIKILKKLNSYLLFKYKLKK